VPTFLVELYLPQSIRVEEVAARARLAATMAGGVGSGIQYVRSTHVAEEEMCFIAFEAPSRDSVIGVARAAGWEHARVIEAVEDPGSDTRSSPPATPPGQLGKGKD
jgi:hypothetical protein